MTEEQFVRELKKINITITANQMAQLNKYYELLKIWNEKINLTNIVEKKQVFLKHFYDSLTLCRIINIENQMSICDIGTGAGFPGLVLKILFPSIKITLVDSLNKRIEFLKLVIKELKLENIEVYHERIEEFAKKNREKYDIVTARAVANLSVLLEYAIPMVKVNKYFIAMKANINEELIESKKALNLLNSKIELKEEFQLPYENSNRTLIKIIKEKPTNLKYPRKNNEIRKNHL